MKSAARWIIAGFLLAFGAALAPQRAHADAFTYSTTRRVFKVGNLMLASTIIDDRNTTGDEYRRGEENTAPYLFYVADARTDVKPLNWEFVNPLAPRVVTSEVQQRWRFRDPGHPYTIGQNVTKNMAAYWEVFLSKATIEELLQFDLLFIANHRDTKFTASEREKLRKLVDAGGIVWIEDSARMRIRADGPFFLQDLQFRGTGSDQDAGPEIYAPNHPILNTPYRLTYAEVANLGDKNYGDYYLSAFNQELDDPTGRIERDWEGNRPPNPEVLINIIGNRAAPVFNGLHLPYVAAGNYGSGAVIATAGDIGDDINVPVGGTVRANRGAFSGENLQAAHTGDLKFVYNLVAWGGANNTERRNPRRTASSFESVGAPLVTRFDLTEPLPNDPAPIVASQSAPLIVKNILFVAGVERDPSGQAGPPTLRAYDTQPFRDADNDGNPDDGRPDLIFGTTYDEIWRAELQSPAGGGASTVHPSSPTFATVLDDRGVSREVIFVTLSNGELQAFEAFGREPDGRLRQSPVRVYSNPPVGVSNIGYTNLLAAPSPVFYEGRLHVVQPDGLIRCVNATTGTDLWTSFGQGATPAQTLMPLGSPTVGFTRLQTGLQADAGSARITTQTAVGAKSGGNTLDLMLYLPVQEGTSGSGAGRILPYWLGARNEVLDTPIDPTNWTYNTRVAAGNTFRYFVAKGPNNTGGPDGPFITAVGRVYAAEPEATPSRTARQNYEEGRESENWVAEFLADGQNGALSGRVRIVARGDRTTQPSNVPRDNFIVAVDYDLLHVTNDPSAGQAPAYGKPPGLTGDGSRDLTRVLRTPGTFAGGLAGLALSPDDFLIYSSAESGGAGTLTSIYATNEQTPNVGATKTRWRFTLHGGLTDVAVGGTTVSDPPPLQNALQFNPAAPEEAVTLPAQQPSQPPDLTQIEPVGAPIVTNDGISYVLARANSAANGPVSVLMAFQTNQQIVLNVGPMQQSTPVSIAQYDALNNSTVPVPQNQYRVDYTRGRITIDNFLSSAGSATAPGALAGNGISASQSFVVTATLAGSSAPTTQIHAPLNSEFRDDFTPLLWYYVLPGQARSSPTLVGDYIYFTRQRGPTTVVTAVDAKPGANDPTVRRGQQITNVVARRDELPQTVNHVRWDLALAGPLAGGQPTAVAGEAAPVGAQGTLAVNTDVGPFAFEDAVTLIADGKRVLETQADGTVIWSLDSTVKYTTAGGQTPVFVPDPNNPSAPPLIANQPATGRVVEERKSIARPSTARRLSQSDLLIADTGNNRVVRVDRAGKVLWDLEKINDAYKILASGDPLTLNSPTDVQFWIVYNYGPQGQITGYEAHYLVADAGNFRIIEVVDFYDDRGRITSPPLTPADTPGERVLIWTTRTASREGRRLRYQSVERFFIEGNVNGVRARIPYVVAVVGNTRAAGTDATATSDFTGGALVNVAYNPYGTIFYDANNLPLNPTLWQPGNPGNPATSSEPSRNGLILASVDDLIMPDNTVKRITRPLYFQQLTLPNGTPEGRSIYLLCDAEGVYEIEPQLVNNRIVRRVTWYFTQDDYNRMNTLPRPGGQPRLEGAAAQLPRFLPSAVRRLGSGNYLITNSYTGTSPLWENRQFLGEVVEVDPGRYRNPAEGFHGGDFAGFSVPTIIAGNAAGTYRQQMGSSNNTYLLEQPMFADRLF